MGEDKSEISPEISPARRRPALLPHGPEDRMFSAPGICEFRPEFPWPRHGFTALNAS
ncbi:MAG: hypothetical protein GXY74_01550 [Phycisphaerae bacterium]|nr:hypothetical protein [Phycisphaerae bacterium]